MNSRPRLTSLKAFVSPAPIALWDINPPNHVEGKKPMPLGKALFPSYIDQEWGHLACKTVCSLVFLCKCAEWHEHAARQAGIRFYESTPLFYS